jgi:glycosyltransferase involved in cell wall biosynthesis
MQKTPSDFGLISLVIPLYNEGQNVQLLASKIAVALEGYNYQIILVNDGSTDDTQLQLEQLEPFDIIIIELQKNYGQSIALAAGIDHAKGEYIVTLDGDLQNDPNDIPMMLKQAKNEDWDVVAGIRVNRKDPFLKTIPSKIANYIIQKSTTLDLKDYGCALKVFTKDIAKELNLYGGMHRFINLLAHLNGARIVQVPVHHKPRQLGVSKYGLGRTFKVINDLIVLLTLQNSKKKSLSMFGQWILRKYNLSQNKTLYSIKNISVFEK